MIGVGEKFPDWTLTGVSSANNIIEVDLGSPNYHWKVIYFYPKDFTFICPTEIAEMDMLVLDSDAHVIGISGDNEFCKLAWKKDNRLIRNINHTLCADTGLFLSHCLGIVEDSGVCYRATFIVDPEGTIQHVSCNALDTGRNAHEIYRTLTALQSGGLTGCAWEEGEEFVA